MRSICVIIEYLLNMILNCGKHSDWIFFKTEQKSILSKWYWFRTENLWQSLSILRKHIFSFYSHLKRPYKMLCEGFSSYQTSYALYAYIPMKALKCCMFMVVLISDFHQTESRNFRIIYVAINVWKVGIFPEHMKGNLLDWTLEKLFTARIFDKNWSFIQYSHSYIDFIWLLWSCGIGIIFICWN